MFDEEQGFTINDLGRRLANIIRIGAIFEIDFEVAKARVKIGDILGQMGNSGNSSEPHLHVHAQRGLPEKAPLAGMPLWLTIDNRFLVRNDTLHVVP
mgnify:CR=1 FL=1